MPGQGNGDASKTADKSSAEAGFVAAPATRLSEFQETAKRLLEYAAENGMRINPEIRSNILAPRHDSVADWDPKTVGDLLAAVTVLTRKLSSVPVEILKARAGPSFRKVKKTSIILGIVIVLFSALSFFESAISASIKANIVTANDLAVKLSTQLGPQPTDQLQLPGGITTLEVVTELQQYASTIRTIYAQAQQLRNLVRIHHDWIPTSTNQATAAELSYSQFQLPVPLTNFWRARDERTLVYQRVRAYGQNTLDSASFLYGTITACILPVLYALFGTCAYLLRTFDRQVNPRECDPAQNFMAHFLTAGIGGAVVGLFHYGPAGGASISPLAIAFLVGYSVDVFFAFLDGVVQAFKRKPGS